MTFAHDSGDARHTEIQHREMHRANEILRRDILHGQISRDDETKLNYRRVAKSLF